MVNIPLARSDYSRSVAKEAQIRLRNRYFEENPVLNEVQSALIARPGLKKYLYVGEGPIRGIYSQPGSFNDAVFVASGSVLYRIEKSGIITQIGPIGGGSLTAVQMAATAQIGDVPAFLFVAGGGPLECYVEDGFALGTVSGTPADGDVIRIDSVYYQFTSGSVDTGTPAGTIGSPWLVALGASAGEAWTNFAQSINLSGIAGTQYSTATTENESVQPLYYGAISVIVRAIASGTIGNSIVTTETGAGISWNNGTLEDGGEPLWFPVFLPDEVNVIDVGYINSYVIVVPAQNQEINGRFYWIEPGETIVDPLNFATAECAPDPISGVVVFGDQFWLPGPATTEVWYTTGDPLAPMLRLKGVVFDRGAWPGTAVRVKDSMIIVDVNGAVSQIGPGGLKTISRPDIEERIRNAIGQQAAMGV